MTAVIYARVSSTTDRQTTDRQVADLMNYAAANQLQVVRVFEEKISGAKQNKEREVLQAALEYCKLENVDYLLSNELSRIGRNTFNVLETIKFLIDNNYDNKILNIALETKLKPGLHFLKKQGIHSLSSLINNRII